MPKDPDYVAGNSLYSLQGAQFGIYRDRNCTNLVEKVTTDANGIAKSSSLPLDTYYVKEIEASAGYTINPQVFIVEGGNYANDNVELSTAVVTVEEPEKPDPPRIILNKVGTTPSITDSNTASLGGAVYKVSFYTSYISTEGVHDKSDIKEYTPERVWYFNSVASGNFAVINPLDTSAYIASKSDPLYSYTYEHGVSRTQLPKGTLVFEEVTPPNGWLVNDKVIVCYIQENDRSEVLYVDEIPDFPEQNLQFTLKKLQQKNSAMNKDIPISGATFVHRYKVTGSNTWTYDPPVTTDENGKAAFTNLLHGTHEIYEESAPDGYKVNTAVVSFTVTDSNQITDIKGNVAIATDDNGTIDLGVIKGNGSQNLGVMNGEYGDPYDGCIEAIIMEQPKDFSLNIKKVSKEKGIITQRPLAGATFGIYSDDACKKLVDTQTSDSAGNLTFEGLRPYTDYWIKEIASPKGYNYQVNYGIDDYTTHIFIENVPQNNTWSVTVGSKKYTPASPKDSDVEVSYTNKILDISLIRWSNKTFAKLPKTGSSLMIILVVCGVCLMTVPVVTAKRKRKKK